MSMISKANILLLKKKLKVLRCAEGNTREKIGSSQSFSKSSLECVPLAQAVTYSLLNSVQHTALEFNAATSPTPPSRSTT